MELEELDISNFFPYYPSVDNDDFYQKIYEKEELYKEKFTENDENVLKHQKIVARFLSPYTPYDRLLLFHEPGTGKTCTATNVYEYFRNEMEAEKFIGGIQKKKFKGAVIISKTQKPILDNFRKEIIEVCSKKYLDKAREEFGYDDVDDEYRERELRKMARREFKKHYQLKTANDIVKEYEKHPSQVENDLSNKVIIVDESHFLKPSDKKKDEDSSSMKVYDAFHSIFHNVKNSKVLLLTGTPIRDDPEELFYLVNLILPIDKQISLKQPEYNEEFITKFTRNIRGYVSYVKSLPDSRVNINYVKEPGQPFYANKMTGFQNDTYRKKYSGRPEGAGSELKDDTEFKQIGLLALENKDDTLYGSELYEKLITQKRKDDNIIYNLKKNGKPIIPRDLENYSTKYHKIVDLLKTRPKQNTFIFADYSKGSGLVLLTKILEQNGFADFFTQGAGSKRYALITGDNKPKIDEMLKTFNNPDNLDGGKIRVVLGTSVIGEGITLKNIQQIHMLTPWYNYGKTLQAVARGIRQNSHTDLLERDDKVDVDVYLHAAIPTDKDGGLLIDESVEARFYNMSEKKDKQNKKFEYILKTTAVDCQLEYERNYRDGEDGSRECDYKECAYSCEGIDVETSPQIDYLNNDLIYTNTEDIKTDIMKLYIKENGKLRRFSYKIEDIQQRLGNIYTTFQIIRALDDIVSLNIPLTPDNIYTLQDDTPTSDNSYYIKEFYNIYYISEFMDISSNSLDTYYVANKIQENIKDFNKVYFLDFVSEFTNFINDNPSNPREVIQDVMSKINREYGEIILEETLLAKHMGIRRNGMEPLLEYFKNDIIETDEFFVSKFLGDDKLRCLEKSSIKKKKGKESNCDSKKDYKTLWEDCAPDLDIKQSLKEKGEEMSNIGKDSPYIGIIELNKKNEEIFKILDHSTDEKKSSGDARTKSRGRNIQTLKKKDLCGIIENLKEKEDDEEFVKLLEEYEECNKQTNDLRSIIKNYLIKKKLVRNYNN